MSLDATESPESIHRLGPGMAFKGRLLLVDKQRLLSRNSQPYLALVLRDRDGEIQGRAFRQDAKAAFEALEPGMVVDLSGRTQTFHGQRQIDIFNAQKAEGNDADPSLFTPATFLPVEELDTMLAQQIDEVQDPGYRKLLEEVFQDSETGQAFREGPASLHGHHNYRHGLLEHTVAVTWMASETAQIPYPDTRGVLPARGAGTRPPQRYRCPRKRRQKPTTTPGTDALLEELTVQPSVCYRLAVLGPKMCGQANGSRPKDHGVTGRHGGRGIDGCRGSRDPAGRGSHGR